MALTTTIVDQQERIGTGSGPFTVTGLATGTAAADRVTTVIINHDSSGTLGQLSLTINGVSATTTDSFGWSAPNPSGTTASVVFTDASATATIMDTWGGFRTVGDVSAVVTATGSAGAATSPQTVSDVPPAGSSEIAQGFWVGTGTPTLAFTSGVTGGTQFASTVIGGFLLLGVQDYAASSSINVTDTFTGGSGTAAFGLNIYNIAASGGGGVNITGTGAIPATDTTATFAGTGVETPIWSLVGISEAAVTASGNYTLTEPAGCQLNDILVVDFAIRSTVIYTNADWIFPQSDSGGNTTNATTASDTSFESGYCIRGSSAPSLVFLRASGSRALGTIRAYRSNRAGTPSFDTSAKFGQTVASTTITLSGGITTAQDAELLTTGVMLARGAASNNASNMDAVSGITTGSGALSTTTPPTIGTWIERSDRGNTTSPTVGLACYDGIMGTAGSTGNLSVTAASSALNGMIVMAFKHPSAGATLAVAGGSYALTGTAATLKHSRAVGAGAGSYALTGTDATLRKAKNLAAGAGSYALTGTAAGLNVARKVAAGAGSYALTGTAATLKHGYAVTVGAGSYSLSGTAATLKFTRLLTPAAGSYTLTGTAATLKFTRLLIPAAGSYTLTGTDATLTKLSAQTLAAASGSYAVTGSDVSLVSMRVLAADAGSYVLTGTAAALSYQPGIVVETASGGDDGPSRKRLKKYQQNEEKFQRQKREREEALNATMEGRTKKPPSLKNTAELGGPKVIEIDDDDDDYDIMMWAAA